MLRQNLTPVPSPKARGVKSKRRGIAVADVSADIFRFLRISGPRPCQ